MRTLLEGGASGAPQSTEESKAWITRLVETEDGGDWEKRYVCMYVCMCDLMCLAVQPQKMVRLAWPLVRRL